MCKRSTRHPVIYRRTPHRPPLHVRQLRPKFCEVDRYVGRDDQHPGHRRAFPEVAARKFHTRKVRMGLPAEPRSAPRSPEVDG